MKIIKSVGKENIAHVYIGNIDNKVIEFAESLDYPKDIYEKWVLTISCLYGCPAKCLMCDAGKYYDGRMSKEAIISQIEYMILKRFPDRNIPVKKFKIQFARMGEPAFNLDVLEVLKELPNLYNAPGLIPSISTIGPKNSEYFFDKIFNIKEDLYKNGKFQLQISIHTTNINKRDELIPIKKLSFTEISQIAEKFVKENDRKITLNFIVLENYPIEPNVIAKYFDPNNFFIKLTPLNPTSNAIKNKLKNSVSSSTDIRIKDLLEEFDYLNYESVVSFGNPEENNIGSNCGQYITNN